MRAPSGKLRHQTGPRGLSGVLAERCTGFNPLTFTAVRKPERRLAEGLGTSIPAAIGLTLASLALIAGKSSGMAAGSSPSRSATRFTADCKIPRPGGGERGLAAPRR